MKLADSLAETDWLKLSDAEVLVLAGDTDWLKPQHAEALVLVGKLGLTSLHDAEVPQLLSTRPAQAY